MDLDNIVNHIISISKLVEKDLLFPVVTSLFREVENQVL